MASHEEDQSEHMRYFGVFVSPEGQDLLDSLHNYGQKTGNEHPQKEESPMVHWFNIDSTRDTLPVIPDFDLEPILNPGTSDGFFGEGEGFPPACQTFDSSESEILDGVLELEDEVAQRNGVRTEVGQGIYASKSFQEILDDLLTVDQIMGSNGAGGREETEASHKSVSVSYEQTAFSGSGSTSSDGADDDEIQILWENIKARDVSPGSDNSSSSEPIIVFESKPAPEEEEEMDDAEYYSWTM